MPRARADGLGRGARVFIGLGSNLGDREERIRRALEWLAFHRDMELVSHTAAVETEPWGDADQPRFLNAVAEIRTTLPPHALLAELKRAEQELGRREGGRRWGPREIDLDILLFGEAIVESAELTVPHAHLLDRPFVLVQLVELDPALAHPVTGVLLRTLV